MCSEDDVKFTEELEWETVKFEFELFRNITKV